jgi:hypothetical protein
MTRSGTYCICLSYYKASLPGYHQVTEPNPYTTPSLHTSITLLVVFFPLNLSVILSHSGPSCDDIYMFVPIMDIFFPQLGPRRQGDREIGSSDLRPWLKEGGAK